MTKEQVANVARFYITVGEYPWRRVTWPKYLYDFLPRLVALAEDRSPTSASERKVMRWLGFAQGLLFAGGQFKITDLKYHNLGEFIVPDEEETST